MDRKFNSQPIAKFLLRAYSNIKYGKTENFKIYREKAHGDQYPQMFTQISKSQQRWPESEFDPQQMDHMTNTYQHYQNTIRQILSLIDYKIQQRLLIVSHLSK